MSKKSYFARVGAAICLSLFSGLAFAGAVAGYAAHNEYNGNPNDGCSSSATGPSMGTSNPVNFLSGNKYHEETLYQGNGEFPLQFKLFYNSRKNGVVNGASSVYGEWTYSYSQHLKISTVSDTDPRELVELVREDGQSLFFIDENGTGEFYSAVWGHDQSASSNEDRYLFGDMWRTAAGTYTYTSHEGVKETFNAQGRLIEVRNLFSTGVHKISYVVTSESDGKLGTYTVFEETVIITNAGKGSEVKVYLKKHFDDMVPIKFSVVGGPSYPLEIDVFNGYTPKFCTDTCTTVYSVPRLTKISWPDGGATQFQYNTENGSSEWIYSTALTDVYEKNSAGQTEYHGNYIYSLAGMVVYVFHDTPAGNEVYTRINYDPVHYDQYTPAYTTTSHNNRTVINEAGRKTNFYIGPNADGVMRVTSVSGDPIGSCVGSNASYTYASDTGYLNTVTNGDTGLVVDYDYYASNFVNDRFKHGVIDKVTYVGVDQGSDRVIDYSWTLKRQLESVISPNLTQQYGYNSSGRISSVVQTDTISASEIPSDYTRAHPVTRERTYDYTYYPDDTGSSLYRIDTMTEEGPRGEQTVYHYDESGHLQSVTNHYQQSVTFSGYNVYGLPTLVMDPNGVSTTLGYTSQGRLETMTTAGRTTTFDYDIHGQLISVAHQDGSFLNFTYGDRGEIYEVENQLGESLVVYRSNDVNLGTSETATTTFAVSGELRSQSKLTYDALGRLWKVYVNDTLYRTYDYDADGNPTLSSDISGGAVSKVFDVMGRLLKIRDQREVNSVTSIGYNRQDRVTSVQHSGIIARPETHYYYDGLGNLLREDSPTRGSTTYYYDSAGNVVRKVDAAGTEVIYSYDMLNRITGIDYPFQPDVTYHYDATYTQGQVNKGVGRLTGISTSDGQSINWIYDSYGNVIKDIRIIGYSTYVTSYEYNAANKLIAIHYPGGVTIDYQRLNGVVDSLVYRNESKALASGIKYEPFGPLSNFMYGNGLGLDWTYDHAYRAKELHAGSLLNLGYTYELNHGGVNWITDLSGGERNQEFRYSDSGRLEYATSGDDILQYQYDPLGNRTSFELVPDGNTSSTFSEGYEYGLEGFLVSRGSGQGVVNYTYTDTGSTRTINNKLFEYDNSGRLITVSDSGIPIAYYSHNPLGQRDSKVTDEGEKHFVYNLSGQLLYEGSSDGHSGRNYVYLDNMLAAIIDSSSVWYGVYDDGATAPVTYQSGTDLAISEADLADGKSYYAYRPLSGNGSLSAHISDFTASTTGTEVGLELRSGTSSSADYVRVTHYSNQPIVLIHGDIITPILLTKEEMVRVTYKNATGEHVIDYPMGSYQYFKIEQSGGEVTVYASADGAGWSALGSPIDMPITSGAVIGFRVDGVVGGEHLSFSSIATSGGVSENAKTYYVHTDHLGTPQVITNDNQQVVWEAFYKPFGEAVITTAAIENNIRFPGQYFDEETGLHYNYFRDYDPSTGRYVESDPIGLRGGLNTFAYVGGQPISRIDPLGLFRFPNEVKKKYPDIVKYINSIDITKNEKKIQAMMDHTGVKRQDVIDAFTPGKGPCIFADDSSKYSFGEGEQFGEGTDGYIVINEDTFREGPTVYLDRVLEHETVHYLDFLDGSPLYVMKEPGWLYEDDVYGGSDTPILLILYYKIF